MHKNIAALKPRQLIKLLESASCKFYREGKGDHRLYIRYVRGKKRVVPIDMGLESCHRLMCFGYLGNLALAIRK